MPFDYKKEYKDLYQPKQTPSIIEVPEIVFVGVEGKGNPNDENGPYAAAMSVLYSISYTIKMSHMGSFRHRWLFSLCSSAAGRVLVDGKRHSWCGLWQ